MMTLDDLPDISFVETDPDKTKAEIIISYEAITGRTLAPGDPVRLFLETIASIIIHQRVLINFSCKQNLLRYSSGDFLDHLGSFSKTMRFGKQPARTTMRITLSAPQSFVVIIPEGTRYTPDGQLYFATESLLEIEPGQTTGTVTAVCTTPGKVGNGFVSGQINMAVDPTPWVSSAENITTSNGGSEEEPDDDYRYRIWLAPESFSTAGPEDAYKYWAKQASPLISDVGVLSPSDGCIEIRPLLRNGEIPSQEILDLVNAICNDKKVRPLTDNVTVLAPEIVNYDINLTYYITSDLSAQVENIQTAVTKAVNDCVTWQKEKLGRDINTSELIARAVKAGAKRVEITAPVYTPIDQHQVAIAGNVTINYGGLENA